MGNRAYILLFAICIQFGPSVQQLRKLGKRLDYMEAMINSMTLKTQFDISGLRNAIELLNNKTEGESSAHVDVSPRDAAAIAGLESEMKKAIKQITAIAKAVSDEKKYARQQVDALELVKETIANQSIDEIESDLMETKEMNSKLEEEIREVKSDLMATKDLNSKLEEEVREVKSDLMATKEVNSKLKEEVQKVNSDLMATKEKLKKEVEKNNVDILELKQMIMEMKKTELGYSSAAVTVPAHLLTCPDGWVKFQDTCYLYVTNDSVNWDVAETRCAERGGILAEPDTEEKMRYLLSLAYYNTWLGGTDRQTEGTWVWSASKRTITFFLWGEGQPSNDGGNQNCLEIWGYSGLLNDRGCRDGQNYICEKPANV